MTNGNEVRARGEEGFTLVEALIAIIVLVFGLIAVTNLLVVAAASNTVGNHSTATTAAASEILERLKSRSFTTLIVGGDVDHADAQPSAAGWPGGPNGAPCIEDGTNDCVVPGTYNAERDLPGVGRIRTVWEIVSVDGQTIFIRVRSQSTGALTRGRSQSEFTTVRSCTSTLSGCPNP